MKDPFNIGRKFHIEWFCKSNGDNFYFYILFKLLNNKKKKGGGDGLFSPVSYVWTKTAWYKDGGLHVKKGVKGADRRGIRDKE